VEVFHLAILNLKGLEQFLLHFCYAGRQNHKKEIKNLGQLRHLYG